MITAVMAQGGSLMNSRAHIQTAFTEVLKGDSDAIGQMDADFSHNPRKVPELAAALETCDIAVGSLVAERSPGCIAARAGAFKWVCFSSGNSIRCS
jgi:hypothetical protein